MYVLWKSIDLTMMLGLFGTTWDLYISATVFAAYVEHLKYLYLLKYLDINYTNRETV